jgi:spore coat protein A, manganese oxidase
MRNFAIAAFRFSLFAALFSVLCAGAFGQTKLRNALDYNGDGRADFTIFRPSTNTWFIVDAQGGIRVQHFGSANEDFLVPADYDGDNIADIAVWRDTTGVWYRLNSLSNTFTFQTWGQTGDEPVARDFDGDNKADMTVVRRTGGTMTWYVFGSMLGFYSFQFGNSTDFTAPGDYDGDGKFQAAVQRPGATPTSPATFYIKTDQGFDVYTWGQSNDLVVPGDYDGDGKTDVAVVREGLTPTDVLTWYIRRSTDGSADIRSWGVTGTDLTAQNDYDGDGKTDLAIWRNSDGHWYIFRSRGDGFDVVWWGESNDFPVSGYDTH